MKKIAAPGLENRVEHDRSNRRFSNSVLNEKKKNVGSLCVQGTIRFVLGPNITKPVDTEPTTCQYYDRLIWYSSLAD
jgi:hypothetical protein